ncbi:MAG: hypothetical protein WCO19_01940 [Candidatus Saccharibacteria bacterium]
MKFPPLAPSQAIDKARVALRRGAALSSTIGPMSSPEDEDQEQPIGVLFGSGTRLAVDVGWIAGGWSTVQIDDLELVEEAPQAKAVEQGAVNAKLAELDAKIAADEAKAKSQGDAFAAKLAELDKKSAELDALIARFSPAQG